MKPKLYSDFNGPWYPDFMLLNYNGTLSDLEVLELDLSEGLEITVYCDSDEKEDLEIDGIVKYGIIPETQYPPCWYVDIRGSQLREVKRK